jgi:DNA-directed RNA polymerase beta' subunit
MKRVDFSSRTVITSDANIKIDELRLPIKIARDLTMPVVVTRNNIEELQKLVRNGRHKYPGVNFIIPVNSINSGKRYAIDVQYRKTHINLKYGDIVERHLQNGDYVLLNRQPSLHKLSMMAHRVVIMENPEIYTFGLNANVTSPYNAD